MAASDPVLIDTCIWVPYFNRPQSDEKRIVDELLDEDRVVLIGPVLAEILQGFRRNEEADWVASRLRGLRFLQVTFDDWQMAGRLGRRAAAAGQQLPLSDLVLAAVAVNYRLLLYSTDPHFDRFEELARFGQ
jgi:predicted nucleic acid-binding protein